MPVDARSLLRAATASSSEGIKDRFASYHPKTRALRCLACNYLPIKHESLWASHTASKSHRSNVAQVRKKEEEQEEKERRTKNEQAESTEEPAATGSKRKGEDDVEETDNEEKDPAKRARKDPGEAQVDSEWERFQREVLNAPTATQQPAFDSYADATIEVAPELIRGINGLEGVDDDEVEEEVEVKVKETDAEKRARLEREEREEILARFEEEQRVQDEADERVSALKDRLQRLRQARNARKG